MATKLYVGNIPYRTTAQELTEFFTNYGGCSETNIITDRETGRSRGFAFVIVENQSEGLEADGMILGGRELKVSVAEERERPQLTGNRHEYHSARNGRY